MSSAFFFALGLMAASETPQSVPLPSDRLKAQLSEAQQPQYESGLDEPSTKPKSSQAPKRKKPVKPKAKPHATRSAAIEKAHAAEPALALPSTPQPYLSQGKDAHGTNAHATASSAPAVSDPKPVIVATKPEPVETPQSHSANPAPYHVTTQDLSTPTVAIAKTSEINLRCETIARQGKSSTRGVFFISLMPSLVNPDSQADFRIMSIDANHNSIVRDTTCFAYRCAAMVSPTYYDLSVQNKDRDLLKLTLNRTNGAFYGHEIRTKAIVAGFGKGDVKQIDESGFCSPIQAQATLF